MNLTRDRLCLLLSYSPTTGEFIRIASHRTDRIGMVAGARDSGGAIQIRVDGQLYLAHRLAWLVMTGEWPPALIDHRDGNPSNNAWSNLRLATNSENMANARLPKNNTSGAKGVSRIPSGRWRVQISVHGKKIHVGTHNDVETAQQAYFAFAKNSFGDFARMS